MQVRKDFLEYCENFDISTAFDSVMDLLLRPGAKDFTNQHVQVRKHMHVCMYVCMCVDSVMNLFLRPGAKVFTNQHVQVCMYACMYACMYVDSVMDLSLRTGAKDKPACAGM